MKEVAINPAVSVLGLKAYDNHFVHTDGRGDLTVWLQPKVSYLPEVVEGHRSFQIQRGTIAPETTRGDHFHPYDKAVDIFFLEQGDMLLALESTDGKLQELYHISSHMVLIFPPFVAHAVRNVGRSMAAFTTFKTWNYTVDPCSVDYDIAIAQEDVRRALSEDFVMPKSGEYGFDSKNECISQKMPG